MIRSCCNVNFFSCLICITRKNCLCHILTYHAYKIVIQKHIQTTFKCIHALRYNLANTIYIKHNLHTIFKVKYVRVQYLMHINILINIFNYKIIQNSITLKGHALRHYFNVINGILMLVNFGSIILYARIGEFILSQISVSTERSVLNI